MYNLWSASSRRRWIAVLVVRRITLRVQRLEPALASWRTSIRSPRTTRGLTWPLGIASSKAFLTRRGIGTKRSTWLIETRLEMTSARREPRFRGGPRSHGAPLSAVSGGWRRPGRALDGARAVGNRNFRRAGGGGGRPARQ